MNGKGSRFRPVDRNKFNANFDQIFKKENTTMPVKSRAQMQYLAIHHPEVLRKWQQEAPRKMSQLPKHVKKKK